MATVAEDCKDLSNEQMANRITEAFAKDSSLSQVVLEMASGLRIAIKRADWLNKMTN